MCSLHLARFFILFFLCFLPQSALSQSVPLDIKKTVDSLVEAAPQTFSEIHSVLRGHRADTLVMRYFANTSTNNQYTSGQTYALNELGRTYRNKSLYEQAIKLHEQALGIAEKTKNLEFKVASLNYLGVVYRRTSSIRTAMDYNQQALELAETVNNPSESLKRSINISYNCIGHLYQLLKQYDEAISYFKKSLNLEAELSNTLGMAINYQNIGECLEEQGELKEALENYRTSLTYNEEINDKDGLVICKTSMAQVYLKQNRIEDAANLLKATLPMAQKLGDGFLIAPIYINLGWSQMSDGQPDMAEASILEGLKIAEEANLPEAMSRASHLLSELYQKKGDFKKALHYTTMAQNIDKEIVNENTIRYVNDIIYRYDSDKQTAKIEDEFKTELRARDTILLISGIALALLAGIFYILYRQYQLKNDKKLLTLEQSMIRSQMNPHFLFNSLNSIKLYIINNEQKNAVHYLNKFSKLVRKILEASSMREIPLAEELETVELYMNIENIRFSNEIDFRIQIDNDIDPHTIRIPSLILQPFLENALWHGLSSKTGEKKIDLHLSKDHNDFIHIAITDNGIGRAAAEKIKQNKVLKRKSVGIEITKERLANFSKDFQNSFDVEIVDLYDADHKAVGTKVVLHIPTA